MSLTCRQKKIQEYSKQENTTETTPNRNILGFTAKTYYVKKLAHFGESLKSFFNGHFE
jgi:hypothetical protein